MVAEVKEDCFYRIGGTLNFRNSRTMVTTFYFGYFTEIALEPRCVDYRIGFQYNI